jgi:hypothetical protein
VKDHPAWWSIVAVAITGALVAAALIVPRRFGFAVFGALALAVLTDAPLFTFVEPGAPPAAEPRQTHDRDAEIVAQLDGVHDRWRLYDEFVLGERAGARLGIRDFRGYPAVDPISLHRYVDVLDFAKRDPRILTDYNVRYVLDQPHWRYGGAAAFPQLPAAGFSTSRARPGEAALPNGSAVLSTTNRWLYVADHPAPLIAWYGAVTVVPDGRDQVLAAVRAVEQPDGRRERAIVELSDAVGLPPEAATGAPGSREGTLVSYEPDTIRFTVEASSAGLVVLDEIMFPGWRVMVDGVRTPSIRANYLLRGVWVSAGHHEIVWQFAPAHWRFLVGGYAIAWLVILVALGDGARDRRRRARASSRSAPA